MKLAPGMVALALSMNTAFAAVSLYGQCGGTGYTGETVCVSGAFCNFTNEWYSQCIPGTSTLSSSSAATSTSKPPTSTTSTVPTSTPTVIPSTGFVRTSGQEFVLDGKKFTVVGSNSYWVGLGGLTTTDMAQAFADIAGSGATVVRTMGFNEVTSVPWNAYYQIWNGKTPTINTGADGLGNFDNVVAAAKAKGLRLIVALTNNWADFGGMDVYVRQILGSENHDLFYTDASVKAAFKNYIKAFVGRYLNEPTILGWELANEPRCRGSTGTTSGSCTPATVTAWAKEISAYIKSIDKNHLVGLGDEGFFNQPGHASYPYQGGEGIDFDVNLGIPTLDFGTLHAYPGSWGGDGSDSGLSWGNQWIKDHVTVQKKYNKPVIMEEFGVTTNQASIYTSWLNTVVTTGLTGDLIWQAGSHYSWGDTHNDGYAVYPDSAAYPVLKTHSAALKARASLT